MVIFILCTSPSTDATFWGVFSSRDASSVTSIFFAFALNDAAIPVLPINDTVRRITEEKTNVVDRRGLYSVQTPQGFRPELIYAASSKAKNTEVTDDASLLENTLQRVASVEGEVHNIKITTPADIEQARWIINSLNHVRIK